MKLFLFFFMIVNIIQSQVKFSVIDIESKLPVSYADVWKNDTYYTTTDSLGFFSVKKEDLKDRYRIIALGYNEIALELNENQIQLKTKFIQLDEIKIIKRKNKLLEKIGKAKRGDSFYGVQFDSKSAKSAKFFPNNSDLKLFVNKIKCCFSTTDKNRIVNVLFYSVGDNGQPENIINSNNKICRLKKGTNIIEIDVSDLNIEFPKEGIFVVVEHLLLEQNKKYTKPNSINSYYYEPLVAIDYCNKYVDTWYLKGIKWEKNNSYSNNIQIIISN